MSVSEAVFESKRILEEDSNLCFFLTHGVGLCLNYINDNNQEDVIFTEIINYKQSL